jgi:hypothetical protein
MDSKISEVSLLNFYYFNSSYGPNEGDVSTNCKPRACIFFLLKKQAFLFAFTILGREENTVLFSW